jgi:signal transduction histidine kinase
VERLLDLQYEVEDIMRERHFDVQYMLHTLLEECADELEALAAQEFGEGYIVERIAKRIREEFGAEEMPSREILLHEFVPAVINEIRPHFSHRNVDLTLCFEPVGAVLIPEKALRKVVEGLVRNAVENTPDGGKAEVSVQRRGNGVELTVRDYGIGITQDNQRRIFEGFFHTQETIDYSSKRPYDFNAGGKGADLLRMKIFSERYGFEIDMISHRCRYIPEDKDRCPGIITECRFCNEVGDCHDSGGTTFRVFFPPVSAEGARSSK